MQYYTRLLISLSPVAGLSVCAKLPGIAVWNKFFFVAMARFRLGSRVSLQTDLKCANIIRLGRRCKVHARATLDAAGGGGIAFDDGVTINRHAMIQGGKGGVRIGRGSEINNFSVVNGTGGVTIGADVLIGTHVRLISYQHEFSATDVPIKAQGLVASPILIEDDVWIGAGATILAGVTLGRGSVVGAGAVVTRSCAPGSVLIGIPARVVRKRFDAELPSL